MAEIGFKGYQETCHAVKSRTIFLGNNCAREKLRVRPDTSDVSCMIFRGTEVVIWNAKHIFSFSETSD